MGLTLPHCLAIAILATQLEILPKGGLDNIMITWGTTALAYGFMYLDCIEAYIIPILTTAPIIMFVCAKKALTKWGVVAAIALDVLVSVAFGNAGFVVLCAFLIGSIIIDKIKKHHKNQGRDEKEKKGDCRDFMQVLANGFACAIFAVVFLITRNNIFVIPFLAGIAEAFSDTAASGIGAFSEKTFDPFKWQKCEKGLSGGMSFVGTVASLAASVLIALLGFVCGMYCGIGEFLIISFCGFLGAIFDSFIGSLMQVKYKCSVCGSITEREEHCSVSAERYSGFIAFDNDVVNIVSSSFAALLALILIL